MNRRIDLVLLSILIITRWKPETLLSLLSLLSLLIISTLTTTINDTERVHIWFVGIDSKLLEAEWVDDPPTFESCCRPPATSEDNYQSTVAFTKGEGGGVLPRLPYQRTQAQAHRLPSLFIQLRASTKKKKINPHAMRLIANIVKLDEEFDKSWRDGAGKRQYLPLAGHIEFECQRQ